MAIINQRRKQSFKTISPVETILTSKMTSDCKSFCLRGCSMIIIANKLKGTVSQAGLQCHIKRFKEIHHTSRKPEGQGHNLGSVFRQQGAASVMVWAGVTSDERKKHPLFFIKEGVKVNQEVDL